MQRLAFIKDVSFLLVAMCLIMALLFDQKVRPAVGGVHELQVQLQGARLPIH